MTKRFPNEDLELARATFTKDTDQDIRDLAYIEALAAIGSREAAQGLEWTDIRVDVRALVFEQVEYTYIMQPYERKERWVEVARYPLSDQALEAFQRLSDRIDEYCFKYGIKRMDDVFPAIGGSRFHMNEKSTFVDGKFVRTPVNFYCMSNSDPKKIIERIKGAKIKANDRAREIEQQINELKRQIRELEWELESVINPHPPVTEDVIDTYQLCNELGWAVQDRALKALIKHGIQTAEQLKLLSDKELLAIKGVGQSALADIKKGIYCYDHKIEICDYKDRIKQDSALTAHVEGESHD